MPFFSVITPSFNQGSYLKVALESVIQQGEDDYEQIIIDNCSLDETVNVLAHYEKDPHLKIIVEPDRGQSEAINKGFCEARGEIICWLNSDDAYSSGTFQTLRKIFEDPSIDVVFGDALQISYDGNTPERLIGRFEQRHDFIRWWSGKIRLHQPAIFFRRSVREEVGFLNEGLHYAMDYEYWWRMSERHHFYYLPQVLAIQHRQPDSKTIKAWHRVLEEREKIFSPYYFLLGESSSALKKERSQMLAGHYLLQAYAAVKTNRPAAWLALRQAWQQSPRVVLQTSSLGLMRELCCYAHHE